MLRGQSGPDTVDCLINDGTALASIQYDDLKVVQTQSKHVGGCNFLFSWVSTKELLRHPGIASATVNTTHLIYPNA